MKKVLVYLSFVWKLLDMSSRAERINLSNVVASRSFQNILSVLYKYGLSRFVEDY